MKPKLSGWRAITCLAMATGLPTMAPVAQGAIYPIDFDPQFDGTVLVDLPNDAGCRSNPPGIVNVGTNPECTLNLVSADVFPFPAGSPHFVDSGLFTIYSDIADAVFIDSGGNFTQFASRTGSPLHILLKELGGCESEFSFCGALMQFQIGGNENPGFPGVATLTIGTIHTNDGTYFEPSTQYPTLYADYRVPEPGTLSLLLGAFGVGWILKRRKITA